MTSVSPAALGFVDVHEAVRFLGDTVIPLDNWSRDASGSWLKKPSEKYPSVSWDFYSPINGKPCSKPPTRFSKDWIMVSLADQTIDHENISPKTAARKVL